MPKVSAMRTPWRFVADLVSRKPKTETLNEREAVAPEAIALEYHPPAEDQSREANPQPVEQDATETAQTAVQLSPEGAKAADISSVTSVGDEPTERVDIAEPAAAADAPEDSDVTAAAEPGAAPAQMVSEESAEPAPDRPAATGPLAKQDKPTTEPVGEAPVTPTGPKSVLDEMADLDAEVAALRRQLAKKLSEQNAQLRKMLARYDAR
ncbi:hypothetical protein [Neorhizobium sp. NCHU2750]|uniref:hypothetical protein n=1 Tax=Neorhizobium sp. NCHU2750 TaxID=1825976 RepID=UPI000EB6BA25|nr:hypothetical protein NCHU2750_59040 [Neorhizobium sp. NCHU2750]